MTALLRKYGPWLAVALLAVGWVKCYGDKRASEALAQVRADSLRRELAIGDSLRDVLRAKALALDSLQRIATHNYALQRGALTQVQSRADSTRAVLDSILRALPDTAPLSIAITNERAVGERCQQALTGCDSLRVLLTAEVANRDSVIGVLEPSLESTRRLWTQAEKRARPGLFGRLRIGLPYAAAGLVIGALVIR